MNPSTASVPPFAPEYRASGLLQVTSLPRLTAPVMWDLSTSSSDRASSPARRPETICDLGLQHEEY